MLTPLSRILATAREKGYAVGAFNVYNLEGATAVIRAACDAKSPVILQVLPSALALGGYPLIALCRAAGQQAKVPVAVHLDHCPDEQVIAESLEAGITSVMADGSRLAFQENLAFTRKMANKAKGFNAEVEAELGCLTGSEDGQTVAAYEEQLTQPDQAALFARESCAAALAVCIGNRHGKYARPPELDFDRLSAIAKKVSIPLVLHGTSGLPDDLVARAIKSGVCKFNVNTEIRTAYINQMKKTLATAKPELTDIMHQGIQTMQEKVGSQIHRFGSANTAK